MIFLYKPISISELSELATHYDGDMGKAVVDIDKGRVALDGNRWASLSLMASGVYIRDLDLMDLTI